MIQTNKHLERPFEMLHVSASEVQLAEQISEAAALNPGAGKNHLPSPSAVCETFRVTV